MNLDLNNPDIRRTLLAERLKGRAPLVAAALAQEFDVSVDTIRRDLTVLEQDGLVRRVRGGAVPVSPPQQPFYRRAKQPDAVAEALVARAVGLIDPHATVFFDGGTTVLACARRLPTPFAGLVVTPAPAVALAAQEQGANVVLIGGRLSFEGAIAVGAEAERAVARCAADLCLLGTCGLDPGFGLSADDGDEASLKRAMARASARVCVVAAKSRLGRRARHQVLSCEALDILVTDAPEQETAGYAAFDVEVHGG